MFANREMKIHWFIEICLLIKLLRSRIRHYVPKTENFAFCSLQLIAHCVCCSGRFKWHIIPLLQQNKKRTRLQYSKVVGPFVRLFFTTPSNDGRMMVEKFNKYEAFELKMNNEQNKNNEIYSSFCCLGNVFRVPHRPFHSILVFYFCYIFVSYRSVVLFRIFSALFILEMKFFKKK